MSHFDWFQTIKYANNFNDPCITKWPVKYQLDLVMQMRLLSQTSSQCFIFVEAVAFQTKSKQKMLSDATNVATESYIKNAPTE